jgi:Tfp pilus assembly protein PilX
MRISIQKINRRDQRGVSLFIVLVVLLLSLIVVLGGLAVANLNEALVGNQSDAQRAYGAAQALMDAAQIDIQLNGRYCNATALGSNGNNPNFPTGNGQNCTLRYPGDGNGTADYESLLSSIGLGNCAAASILNNTLAGICISGDPTAIQFATSQVGPNINGSVFVNGAQYSRINAVNSNAAYAGSAQIDSGVNAVSLAKGGSYWVEIFPYNVMGSALQGSGVNIPDGTYPFVFRITAMAPGLKANTISVLRAYYVPYPMAAPGT